MLNKAREITRELGIENRVVITGQIEHDKLAKSGIFGACNLFVLASRTETGPLAVLEAQANGLVCVVAKGKGMKLVEDGVNGYIADPNDKQAFANAIVRLLTNRREYVRMKKATLHNIKKYEFAHVIDLWEKTYAKLIKVKKKSISDPSSAF
ncbi:glycosyltransferase family 4 protein [Candidatus Woesearchaeota archaeon]|nr:glycosyltransferase family 4 protein [Candidatus Woesearchaeota archaeon]